MAVIDSLRTISPLSARMVRRVGGALCRPVRAPVLRSEQETMA